MLEDEGEEIAGLLVGLNVIDFNMAIKDKDLDQPVSGHVRVANTEMGRMAEKILRSNCLLVSFVQVLVVSIKHTKSNPFYHKIIL